MPTVKLIQEIFPPAAGIGHSGTHPAKFWTYDLETSFAPRAGDEIHVFGADYTANRVKRAYWLLDGTYCAEMIPYQVDPLPEFKSLADGSYRALWLTDPDGDPNAILASAGWRPYGGA